MKFDIYAPFEVPMSSLLLVKEDFKWFWDDVEAFSPGLSDAYGCYIFGLRAAKGYVPWYVGRTNKQTFEKEIVAEHKLNRYNRIISQKGTPVFFFIAKRTNALSGFEKRAVGGKEVKFLETILIGRALQKNPNLINKQNTKLFKEFSVPGIINSSPGRNTATVETFLDFIGRRKFL